MKKFHILEYYDQNHISLKIINLSISFAHDGKNNFPWHARFTGNINPFYKFVLADQRNETLVKIFFMLNIQAWQEARRLEALKELESLKGLNE